MTPDIIRDGTVTIGVIGLGYVGLPLAAAFGRKYQTIGFDLKGSRIAQLKGGIDTTGEVSAEQLASASKLQYTNRESDLRACNVFIVTVPTPVDQCNQPDLTALFAASHTVGRQISQGGVVVYESTVYPGCTEEDCVPIIEQESHLKFNTDFFAGYSPERINPGSGDISHKLTRVVKVVSGSTAETADFIQALYESILEAGTHRAPSIKVAEAAKVIENSQRDLNIAFVNELAKIFHLMNIDTHDVLEAAATKWNFLKFSPGLVGGHCIGVDPYYLTYKAQALGYLPEVILAGRRINNSMGGYIAAEVVKLMLKRGINPTEANILQLGITFKENCHDTRNSHAMDIVRGLEDFGCHVDVYDPLADADDVHREYQLQRFRSDLMDKKGQKYQVIILAVAHDCFKDFPYSVFSAENAILYDVKGVLPRELATARL